MVTIYCFERKGFPKVSILDFSFIKSIKRTTWTYNTGQPGPSEAQFQVSPYCLGIHSAVSRLTVTDTSGHFSWCMQLILIHIIPFSSTLSGRISMNFSLYQDNDAVALQSQDSLNISICTSTRAQLEHVCCSGAFRCLLTQCQGGKTSAMIFVTQLPISLGSVRSW